MSVTPFAADKDGIPVRVISSRPSHRMRCDMAYTIVATNLQLGHFSGASSFSTHMSLVDNQGLTRRSFKPAVLLVTPIKIVNSILRYCFF